MNTSSLLLLLLVSVLSLFCSCLDASFEWTIQATKSGGYEVSSSSSAAATTSTTLVGRSVTFKAAGVGEHTVKLTVTHPTDGTTAQLASSVQSK